MIHISKTKKGKFIVANIADNGEILKVSETLNTKANAWKNIKAEMKSCYPHTIAMIQDNTSKIPMVYLQGRNREAWPSVKTEKPYTPK